MDFYFSVWNAILIVTFIFKAISEQSKKSKQSNRNRPTNSTNSMESIQDLLTDIFGSAISAAYPDIPDPPVVIALSGNNVKFGDYQCNSALQLANMFKQQGEFRQFQVYLIKSLKPQDTCSNNSFLQ